jgi:hypothetical protein
LLQRGTLAQKGYKSAREIDDANADRLVRLRALLQSGDFDREEVYDSIDIDRCFCIDIVTISLKRSPKRSLECENKKYED